MHEKNKQTKLGFETLSPQMYWILRIPYPSPVQIIRRRGGVLAWGTGYFLGLRKSKAAAPSTCPSRVFLSVSLDGHCACLLSPTLQVAASHSPECLLNAEPFGEGEEGKRRHVVGEG